MTVHIGKHLNGAEELLSVVIPVSERHDDLTQLFAEYERALRAWPGRREFVFVLDGAFAQAEAQLSGIVNEREDCRLIRLARRFGESTALTAGFEQSSGGIILTLPAYHQVESAELPKLLAALDGADMAVGRRWPRTDAVLNRIQAQAFHAFVRATTGAEFHDLGCGARALRRTAADEVHLYGDQHRFFPLLARQRGFRVVEVALPQSSLDRPARFYGVGVYPRRLLDLLTVFFLVKFTRKPLRFFGLIGASLFTLGVLALLWIIVQRYFFAVPMADRPALLLSTMVIVLGVQVLALGLIGELVIFAHASELKEYTIDKIVEGGSRASAGGERERSLIERA